MKNKGVWKILTVERECASSVTQKTCTDEQRNESCIRLGNEMEKSLNSNTLSTGVKESTRDGIMLPTLSDASTMDMNSSHGYIWWKWKVQVMCRDGIERVVKLWVQLVVGMCMTAKGEDYDWMSKIWYAFWDVLDIYLVWMRIAVSREWMRAGLRDRISGMDQ